MGLFSFFKKNKEKVEHAVGPYVEIDSENCKGEECGKCVAVCPNNSFIMVDGKAALKEYYTCKTCRGCLAACPNKCIKII